MVTLRFCPTYQITVSSATVCMMLSADSPRLEVQLRRSWSTLLLLI